MVRHAPIHRRSGHSDIAICCGRNVRGSSPSTSVVPLSNQVTTLNHKRFKRFKMFSDGLSEIPSDAMAILRVSLAVMPLQVVFFAQHLAVYQSRGRNEINQADPIREYQKLADQDHHKRDIDGIAAEGKDAVHDELVRMIGVDADAEALPEGNQAP